MRNAVDRFGRPSGRAHMTGAYDKLLVVKWYRLYPAGDKVFFGRNGVNRAAFRYEISEKLP